jgi:hypothetical protein
VPVRQWEGRGTELGVGVPMATGRCGSEPAEEACASETSRPPFYSRRARTGAAEGPVVHSG